MNRYFLIIVGLLFLVSFDVNAASRKKGCLKHFVYSSGRTDVYSAAQEKIMDVTRSPLIAQLIMINISAYINDHYKQEFVDPSFIFRKGFKGYRTEAVDLLMSDHFTHFLFNEAKRTSGKTQDIDLGLVIDELVATYALLGINVAKRMDSAYELSSKEIREMPFSSLLKYMDKKRTPAAKAFIKGVYLEVAYRKFMGEDPRLERYPDSLFERGSELSQFVTVMYGDLEAKFGGYIQDFYIELDKLIRKRHDRRKPTATYTNEYLIEKTLSAEHMDIMAREKLYEFLSERNYNRAYQSIALRRSDLSRDDYTTRLLSRLGSMAEVNRLRQQIILDKLSIEEYEPDLALIQKENHISYETLLQRKLLVSSIANYILDNNPDQQAPLSKVLLYTYEADGLVVVEPKHIQNIEKVFSSPRAFIMALRAEFNKSAEGKDIKLELGNYQNWKVVIKSQHWKGIRDLQDEIEGQF